MRGRADVENAHLWRSKPSSLAASGDTSQWQLDKNKTAHHVQRARGPETAPTVLNAKFEKYPSKFHNVSGIELRRQCGATRAITGRNRTLTGVYCTQLHHKHIKRTRDVMRYSSHRVLRRGCRAICINLGAHSTLAPRWRRDNGCDQHRWPRTRMVRWHVARDRARDRRRARSDALA